MNKSQQKILINFIIVIIITIVSIFALIIIKDHLDRSNSQMALESLGKPIIEYRAKNNSLPPESYVQRLKPNLPGSNRLSQLYYRAIWIQYNCGDEEIVAYIKENYRAPFITNGFLVLRIDGTVEWLSSEQFNTTIRKQKYPMEVLHHL